MKFVTFLSKPLAIHPIQVHSFRKPGVISSVSLLLWFLVFLSREGDQNISKNKTTVELPPQVFKMEQGKTPVTPKKWTGWNEFLFYSFGGRGRAVESCRTKMTKKIYKWGSFRRWESLVKCRLQLLKKGGAWPDSLDHKRNLPHVNKNKSEEQFLSTLRPDKILGKSGKREEQAPTDGKMLTSECIKKFQLNF